MQDLLPFIGVGAAGGPIGIVVSVLGSIVGALFGGIFGGSADDNIIKAFDGLRDQMVKMGNALEKFAWGIAQAAAALWTFLKFIWQNIIRGIALALKGLIDRVRRIMDRILKPMLDAMKAQRAAILDLYNRFLRPIIVAIEKVRRIIHFLQLLHIHIFDGLDRQLAKIEGKILSPIYRLLYRTNTLGNWVNFILNDLLLIRRGLLLGSTQANKGGTFSLVAGAPMYGFTPLPFLDTGAPQLTPAVTYSSFAATANTALVDSAGFATDSPSRNLVACLTASVDLGPGSPIDDLVRCLQASAPLTL